MQHNHNGHLDHIELPDERFTALLPNACSNKVALHADKLRYVANLRQIKFATLYIDVSQQKPGTLILISLIRHIVYLLYLLQLIPASNGFQSASKQPGHACMHASPSLGRTPGRTAAMHSGTVRISSPRIDHTCHDTSNAWIGTVLGGYLSDEEPYSKEQHHCAGHV